MKGKRLSNLRGDTRVLGVIWSRQQVCVTGDTYERVRQFACEHGYTMSEAGRALIKRGLDSE